MRKIIHISILFLIFPLCCQSQTLDDYMEEAANNNPGLRAKYTAFEIALEQVSQVNALPDPKLSFGYFISPIETRVGAQRAKISLSQHFPWFGTLKAREQVATLQAEVKYQEFIDAKNELFFSVKSAYYPLYEIREQIRWQQENISILNTYKSLALSSFSNGRGTMVDVIRVDIMIENAETEIQLLEDKIHPLQINFNNLLNRPDSAEVIILDSLQLINIDSLIESDSLFQNNPILRAIDIKKEAAIAQEAVAKKNGLPQLGVGLDYAIIDQRTDVNVVDNGKNAFMPMVSMTIPIYRGKYKSQVKQAQLYQYHFDLLREETANHLSSSYESGIYALKQAKDLFELYNDQITRTQQALDLLYTAYSNSGKEFEEVLRMQQQLLKYEMAKATELKNFYVALAKINYLTAKTE